MMVNKDEDEDNDVEDKYCDGLRLSKNMMLVKFTAAS